MLKTILNLYDKYKLTKWEQLWADDNLAVVLYKTGKNSYKVITDNGRFVSAQADMTLFEAFDAWNAEINRHLEYR